MKTFGYKIFALTVCLIALITTGCVKNEFKIDFEFPKDHIGNYMLTYYAWDSRGGRWIEQTASIQEGVAAARGITRLPTLVYVSDASSPSNYILIYAERGDKIKISGEGRDMAAWSVKGNKVSERWNEWRKEAYPKKNDDKAFEKSIEEFVKKNPGDQLSAIMMLTEWNRRKNPEGFVKVWNMIDKSQKDPKLIEMCGAPDLLGIVFTTNAEGNLEYVKKEGLKTLTVRSRDNGIDTLKFDKVKGSILYFYSENNSDRREAADSLKHLSRAYPDSTKRIIADIYMDSDSTTWVNFIRRDSIKGGVRAWQPRGLVEDDMVKMGVARVPWYVVKDKLGKETYSGNELKEAVKSFRKIMGKASGKTTEPKTEKKEESKPELKTEKKEESKPELKTEQKKEIKPELRRNEKPTKQSLPKPGQSLKKNQKTQLSQAQVEG